MDLCYWLPEEFHLWKLTKLPRWQAAVALSRLAVRNAKSALKILVHTRRNDLVYIPYPGALLLWLLSWVPRGLRPRCICDAYITIWDTIYQDRGLGGTRGGWLSNLVLRFESRALKCADGLIVDTSKNADHVAATFNVERHRIHALPLAMPEDITTDMGMVHSRRKDAPIRVLFFGTFVPLQGTTKIAQAIELLRDRTNLEFLLIGDGQAAEAAETYLTNHPRVKWLRTWMALHDIKRHIVESDICLGVFGGRDKAARVLPLKIYIALAAGKPIVTQEFYSLPEGCPPIPAHTVHATAVDIANGILSLAEHSQLRSELGKKARSYYIQHLGEASITSSWKDILSTMEA
ncbi:glycosyltransferase [Xanthomonas sp. D-109]|uniref:glycosyltransferase n=1 Tax=Xanthomonas sp. D-109 TaxID=2821274 RepID=UPI001FD0020F|nr:glycosyltransferase [Xanthomonas sp. D-109]